jgi:hypothetical protein
MFGEDFGRKTVNFFLLKSSHLAQDMSLCLDSLRPPQDPDQLLDTLHGFFRALFKDDKSFSLVMQKKISYPSMHPVVSSVAVTRRKTMK